MSKCNVYVGYYEVFITPGRIEDFEPPLGIDTDALSFAGKCDSVSEAMDFVEENYPSADIILDDRLKADAGYFDGDDIFSRKGRIMSSAQTSAEWSGFKAVESEIRSVMSKFALKDSDPIEIYVDPIMKQYRDGLKYFVSLGCVEGHQSVKPELLKDYEVDSPAAKVWDMYESELEMLFGTFESFQAAITSGMWQSVVYDPSLGFMDKRESWVLKDAKQMYDELVDAASEPNSIYIKWYFAVRESDFKRIEGFIPKQEVHPDWMPEILAHLGEEGNTLEVFSTCVIHGYIGNDDVLYDPKETYPFKPAGTFANPKFDLLKEMKSAGLNVN